MSNQHATLDWNTGQPYSTQFEDIYFSTDSGLEETRYVFLNQNHLAERWKTINEASFTIAEAGFGTGLNFLCAWQLWNETAPDKARLHFVSTERYPLSPADLASALRLWPELAALSQQLLAAYSHMVNGWHRLVFEDGRVTLTLLIGDANDTLPQLKARVDAWFLDGFAPAKNPDMWQPALFASMATLSHSETTFATFTSAGMVKRGLEAAGFAVTKVAGFGRKREMLCGVYQGTSQNICISIPDTKLANSNAKTAIVIGAGIAGCASSYALAQRGWQVTLIERHDAISQEASGNPSGVIYPRLTGSDAALGRLALSGYLHILRLLKQLGLEKTAFSACGVLQLAFNSRELTRLQAITQQGLPVDLLEHVTATQASAIAGIELSHEGLYFPEAGWINPPLLCSSLASHRNIAIKTSTEALKLERKGDSWQVWDKHGLIAEAPTIILASANDTMQFQQSAHCELEPVRGQITFLPETAESRQLKTVICTEGYISPASNGVHTLGATFSPNDLSLEVRAADHQTNLQMLKKLAPGIYREAASEGLGGRVALRCTTPDYLPMAGPLLDSVAIKANPPRYNADPATLPWLDGLYINTGHGSKGLINAPLCAEILASAICGEPSPVDSKLLAALDSNRFMLKKMGLKRLVMGLAAFPYCKMR
ncbi:MAG TPA: bifunctional tRNA (5-methylaminomethyl-2-thiouridine)(34)-methyltransferase MnmD/FAD-dependent 5-carboxymethylaminomethyl-2-thiouridine(34) oxidoreductase MnmC [Methylophilaceae bacterium]|nr:bifunctional tRNA (5-methylaminomethyl-2-thiouridine)(34)-methyltransferase MnmD/FAD-dependent 5-carboxymethylaminomethyl-2-thiouridine(34) oxidoreductase MnmC [Methylophilaceae bacterium]